MSDEEEKDHRVLDWITPTVGASAFGVLMYGSIALNARGNLPIALSFIGLAVIAVLIARRITKPYSADFFCFHVFATFSAVWGVTLALS